MLSCYDSGVRTLREPALGQAFALVQLGDALADLFLSDDALAAAVTPETFLPHLASPGPLPVPPPAPAIGTKYPVICVCERHAS
jgi:hypothetical protein